jgi:L-ascorbate metabolism protein UlaG (beta-lactamase superfamily)
MIQPSILLPCLFLLLPEVPMNVENIHWLGYIVTLSTGVRVYHSGDSDAIPEMQTLKVDVALMPCGGTYTMTAAEMAAAANGFKPKVLIPMHWGDIVGSKADAHAVAKAFSETTVIKAPERQ